MMARRKRTTMAPKQEVPPVRPDRHENQQRNAMTLEQLKAATQGADAEKIRKELDRDIAFFVQEHRVSSETLKKQVSV